MALETPCMKRPVTSNGKVGAKMQSTVPAPMMASTRRSALRRPMKSLQRPITGPAMAPARKNIDCTWATASGVSPKKEPMCGSAGVIMLALSWNASTARTSVVMSSAAALPWNRPSSAAASVDVTCDGDCRSRGWGGLQTVGQPRCWGGCSHQTPLSEGAGGATRCELLYKHVLRACATYHSHPVQYP